jgi:hypothetical protein
VVAEAEKRGWNLLAIHEDALSGNSLERPGLAAALAAVEDGKAAGSLWRSSIDSAGC